MNEFNYHSLRATESRAGKALNHAAIRVLCDVVVIVFTALAFYLSSFLPLAVALATLVLEIYAKYHLAKVPVGSTEDINDQLSMRVLQNLPKNPTTQDLARVAARSRSGIFLTARFGLSEKFLAWLAQDLSDVKQIFETARSLKNELDGEVISGGLLALSIVQNHPNSEYILKQMKLEMGDLKQGIVWYNYLHGIVKSAHKTRHTGGIARDLAFGYIPTLSRFGRNLSAGNVKTQIHMENHREVLDKIISIFSNTGRQNVALVGPNGSGRSTIVQALAEELSDADANLPNDLKFRQIFMLDSAALISAGGGKPGRLEALITNLLNEAYAAKNIIICLDNAQLFFEEGTGSVDITNVLLPILEAGRLRLILTMEQQKYLQIAAKNSSLANALNKIIVEPASHDETIKVMMDQIPRFEYQHKVTYTWWSLEEAYRLSERYIHDLEMPGRALNLLESAAEFNHGGLVLAQSVQQAIEKTEGVKIQTVETTEEKSKLLNLEDLIHERMIDQELAVKTVSDALRRAAAGVRNQNRPIGTFLFLGPTGVGKTELAKSLSAVYFGGETDIVRVDLNEYVTEQDVARLIADGADDPLSLTAQIMKQPFSVVLLDEIEKAHPLVLTTLLQLLDEGILRDTKNREVSFRDAIVIATSNAGADAIRAAVEQGQDLIKIKDELTNKMIADGQFKPEFLNRFDEICIFTPLKKEDLAKIVDLLVKGTNKTLAPQKISVHLTDEAKAALVEKGYDPQLGARPMRRVVQKTVENIVAQAVLKDQARSGSTIEITAEMIYNT